MMKKIMRSALAGFTLVIFLAVCDTVGVDHHQVVEVDRFLEAVEAVERGASIDTLDEFAGGGSAPWTIVFIADGAARWREYIRESLGTVSWSTWNPRVGTG